MITLKNIITVSTLSLMLFASCSSTATKEEQNSSNEMKIEEMKKETYVLVHSAWLGAWQWEGVANVLRAEGHNVITPDLPGHGNDKTSPAEITMENYVKTVTDILDAQEEPEIQNAFAHDIPVEAFNGAKPYIVPEPSAPLMYELEITDENFGSIPKYYIECTEDRAIPIEIQRAMYHDKVEGVFTINSSHTPNFSQPEKVAEILLNI